MEEKSKKIFDIIKENIAYLIVIWGIFAFVAVCAFFITKKSLESRLETDIVLIANLAENIIKLNFQSLETTFLEDISRLDSLLKKTNDFSKIEDFIHHNSYKKILFSNGLDSMYIYGIIRDKSISNTLAIPVNDIKKSDWYDNAKKTKGDAVKNSSYIEPSISRKRLISWSKEFLDNSGNSIGVVNFAISYDAYLNLFSNLNTFKECYLFLTDSNNIGIYHPNKAFMGKHIMEMNKALEYFLTSGESGSLKDVTNYLNERTYIFKNKILDDLYIYVVISLESYYKDLYTAISVAFAACFLLWLLLSFLIINQNIKSKLANDENQAKSSFLAAMSHEIRTPLNAIIGLGQLELESKGLPENYKNTIEKILLSGNNLLKIINDILDLSKIEKNKLEIISEEYEVPSLLNDICTISQAYIASKSLKLKVSISPEIPNGFLGDMLRIKQILNNFVSNAAKYTHKGYIELSVDYLIMNGKNCLKFVVKDSGIGIKAENIPKLFNMYERFDNQKNRIIEGTGIGLNIAKKLSDLMGGIIEVKSVYGEGSEFSILIPQIIKDSKPIGKDVAKKLEQFKYNLNKILADKNFARTQLTEANILIVDDVVVNLEIIKGLLNPYNLNLETVTSGQQAIELIKNGNKYDAIFMDHMMPVMDGVEATKIIRSMDSDYAKNVPIIAFTANAMVGSHKMFLEKGFNDLISKPIDIRNLDECLRKWIKHKKSDDSSLEKSEKIAYGIDREKGIAQFGSEEMFNKILANVKNHIPSLLKDVREKNGDEYIIAVHALKGCIKTICANELGNRAYELEQAAQEGNWELVQSKNEALVADVQKLCDSISLD